MIGRAVQLVAVSWGDVPTWLSSVTSLLALVFALVAVVLSRRTFQIESERDRVNAEIRRQQDAFGRRSQAALISVWYGAASRGEDRGVHVRNASETPVYQSHVTILHPAEPDQVTRIRLAVIPPAEQPVFHPLTLPPADRRVSLTFTDGAGVRWLRDAYGRLTELDPRLTVWGAERTEAVLAKFADDLLATYGVTVGCHTDDWPHRLDRYLSSGPGVIADVLDAPHDWIGCMAERGVIESVALPEDQREVFLPRALQALTYRGRLYAVPLTIQCATLLRNLDLAPQAPTTLEALVAHGQALVTAGRARQILAVQVNPFQLSPLFTAAGAPPLAQATDNAYRIPAELLNASALIRAFARLRDLGRQGLQLIDPDADDETAREPFLAGAVPYLIGLSEDLSDAQAAGLRCATSAVPGFADGPSPRPMLSVRGFCIATHGHNRTIARDLVADYLARPDVAHTLTRDLAAPSCLRHFPTPSDVAPLRGSQAATLMPNAPWVMQAWKPLHYAQYVALNGADPTNTTDQLLDALTA